MNKYLLRRIVFLFSLLFGQCVLADYNGPTVYGGSFSASGQGIGDSKVHADARRAAYITAFTHAAKNLVSELFNTTLAIDELYIRERIKIVDEELPGIDFKLSSLNVLNYKTKEFVHNNLVMVDLRDNFFITIENMELSAESKIGNFPRYEDKPKIISGLTIEKQVCEKKEAIWQCDVKVGYIVQDGLPVPLIIKSEMPDANISLLNLYPRYKEKMLLIPGRYEVMVTFPGYHQWHNWIWLDKKSYIFKLKLKPQK
ncbi:MAG: hypothetical protein HON94_13490 [Methylococcales bacterium]|jgi:hypothetical protein|nr:hypothetical protein [Methylococcales bacterium]